MKLKSYVLSLLVLGSGATAQTLTQPYREAYGLDAEFQIFINSRPDPANPKASLYDYKYVSHPGNIVPATFVYPTDNPVNALCFFGNPDHALALFKIMAESMVVEPRISSDGETSLDPARNFKPWLRIDGVNQGGVRWPWFDRVRRCDYAASDSDRQTTPVFLKPFTE